MDRTERTYRFLGFGPNSDSEPVPTATTKHFSVVNHSQIEAKCSLTAAALSSEGMVQRERVHSFSVCLLTLNGNEKL